MCLLLNFPGVEFDMAVDGYVIIDLKYFFKFKDMCVILDGLFNTCMVITGAY